MNLTKDELLRLMYFLCDPFLTYQEALSLAGIRPVKEEKDTPLLAA